jgi:hypothetical protein
MPVILPIWKSEIGRIVIQDQPGQKVHEHHPLISTNKIWAWWQAPVIPTMQEV